MIGSAAARGGGIYAPPEVTSYDTMLTQYDVLVIFRATMKASAP